MKMNRRFLFFCFVWTVIAWLGAQPPQVHAFSAANDGRGLMETAPLPPPTTAAKGDVEVKATLEEAFKLHIGEWATITDTPEPVGVQVAERLSDNRCPAQVNCVVAGQVELMLRVRLGNVIQRQLLYVGTYPVNHQNQAHYGGYTIELAAVEPPAPPPDEELQPSQYVATLVVYREATATPEPTTEPSAIPTPQTDQEPVLNHPFTLRVGESAALQDVAVKLTLRSLTEDSGCITADDCSLMLAEGTLVLQQGDDREVLTFTASFTPEQPFTYDFGGYVIALTHLAQAGDGKQVATFVVKRPTPTVEIPAPERIERCPHFSRFDAAALLQEDVQQEAIANLLFGPLPVDATAAAGFCGYVTSAFSDARQLDETAPALLSEVAADRAVVVDLFDGSDLTRLRQLATLVTAADSAAQTDALLRLQVHLTAGDVAAFIGQMADLAAADPTFTVEMLANRGDEGVWLWQQTEDGYFALLLIRDGTRFQVVMALLNGAAEEQPVRGYALVMAEGQAQGTINEVPPTPQVPTAGPTIACDLLTMDEAAAILGEAVHEPVTVAGEEGSCLYVPGSEAALTPEEAAVTQPEHGVLTQFITGAKVADQLTSLAEEIKHDNPDADEDIFNIIQSQLIAGDTEGALTLLPQLAEGAQNWVIESVPTLDKSLLWLWFTDENHTYSALVGAGDDGTLTVIMASLPVDSKQEEVRAAFYAVISEWVE